MSLALLEQFDSHAGLRNGLRSVARLKGEWAGIPMPLEGERLVLESSYPYAELAKLGAPEQEVDPDIAAGWRVRNRFWSAHKSAWVVVMQDPDGRITYGLQHGIHHLDQDLHTLGCADAWGIEQEQNALQLLATLVRHRAFKQYLLTGSFLESSRRSGIHYMFRRLKPTVAMTPRGKRSELQILCTLCLHPIGYYAGSWAGTMCPTDDVVSHLMMMRGDEHLYWKRANQIPAWQPEAGL